MVSIPLPAEWALGGHLSQMLTNWDSEPMLLTHVALALGAVAGLAVGSPLASPSHSVLVIELPACLLGVSTCSGIYKKMKENSST